MDKINVIGGILCNPCRVGFVDGPFTQGDAPLALGYVVKPLRGKEVTLRGLRVQDLKVMSDEDRDRTSGSSLITHHSSLRFGLVLKGSLLLALLAAHFLTRQQTAKTMFQQTAYADCYRTSLGIMAGRGFCRIGFPCDNPKAGAPSSLPPEETGTGEGYSDTARHSITPSPGPLATPILEFFNFKRPNITRDEFKAYLTTPHAEPIPATVVDAIRILDIRFTAFIWKLFGISWPVYFTFASLASTFSCFLIFAMTRKLTSSFWAGILAGIVFLALPFENQNAIRSVRDISPLWFAILAFGFFIGVVDNFQSRKWNYLTYLALGALAILGMGWRRDALLVTPFLLVGLSIFLLVRHRHWKPSLVAGCLYLVGAGSMYTLVHWLGPRNVNPSGTVFLVAHYGDASRCNLMGLENSFQIPREDYQTIFNAAWYQHGNHSGTTFAPFNQQFAIDCREMYGAAMKYHLFQYVRYWPEFYVHAVGALSQPGQLQGADPALLRQSRLPWALPIYDWCLDYLIGALPFLHFVGILTFFWVGRDKVHGTFLILFSLYYSVIWFAALPEQKHFGQMLLPLAVTGGMGLWGLARTLPFLFLCFDFKEVIVVIPKAVRMAALGALGIGICWLLSCIVAYPYSVRHRESYLNDIKELAAGAVDGNEHIKDRRLFAAFVDPLKSGPPTGYILTIHACANPGYLTCRHVQFPTSKIPGRVFVTHHKLYPSRGQYFAVSCVHSVMYGGDDRPYACTVIVPPGCSISRCRRLDLSAWKKLPFSTVFTDEEQIAGSPVVGRFRDGETPSDRYFEPYEFNNLSSEIAYGYPWHLLTRVGLPHNESQEP